MKHLDESLGGIFEALGGTQGCTELSIAFHQRLKQDPHVGHHFPKNLAHLEERFALCLVERTGGGPTYTQASGKSSLMCRHTHLPLGPEDADHWLACMRLALGDVGIDSESAGRLLRSLALLTSSLVDPLIEFYDLPLNALRKHLTEDPSLVTINDHGRNLMCAAAIACDAPRIALLIEFGADAHTQGVGGHMPLYHAADCSQQKEERGLECVALLLQNGAFVNARTGVGSSTALHMSARRGTVRIAQALLKAGAEINAPDKSGDTPLHRAVNCGRESIVWLLIDSWASPHIPNHAGATAFERARTPVMRAALNGQR